MPETRPTDLTRTPSRPAHPKHCDGLLARLADGGSKQASIARLRDAVQQCLAGKWRIRLINHADRLYEVLRVEPRCQPTYRQAFDMLRKLDAQPAIDFCEIGAIVPGADPRPRQVYATRRAQTIAQGLRDDAHLYCSRSEDWAPESVGAPKAWELPPRRGGRSRGAGIVIAHPDTGYTRHPELTDGGRLLFDRGYDFEDEDRYATDPLRGQAPGHGTATGSVIISSPGDQTLQRPHFVTGIAPGAQLIPIRVSTSVVHLSFRRLVKAVYHAIDAKAHIISMSLGGPFHSTALQSAIRAATNRGIIVIAAAGNVWPFVVYPARFGQVIAVAASNCAREIWAGSAGGRTVDVAAPGESVWRAKTSKRAASRFSSARSAGTSYAAAVTAGVCALWLAHHGRDWLLQKYGKKNLSTVFRETLRATVDRPAGWKTSLHGAGIIDAEKLLAAKLPSARDIQRAVPSEQSGRPIDELLQLCPETDPSRVRDVFARTLSCTPGQLNRELAPYEQELRYLLVTNPKLREMILQRARAKRVAGISSSVLRKPGLLGGKTSRGLARRLGL